MVKNSHLKLFCFVFTKFTMLLRFPPLLRSSINIKILLFVEVNFLNLNFCVNLNFFC